MMVEEENAGKAAGDELLSSSSNALHEGIQAVFCGCKVHGRVAQARGLAALVVRTHHA